MQYYNLSDFLKISAVLKLPVKCQTAELEHGNIHFIGGQSDIGT